MKKLMFVTDRDCFSHAPCVESVGLLERVKTFISLLFVWNVCMWIVFVEPISEISSVWWLVIEIVSQIADHLCWFIYACLTTSIKTLFALVRRKKVELSAPMLNCWRHVSDFLRHGASFQSSCQSRMRRKRLKRIKTQIKITELKRISFSTPCVLFFWNYFIRKNRIEAFFVPSSWKGGSKKVAFDRCSHEKKLHR